MTSRKIIPAVLNLFTLVGGHLYNKRYDRIVVFITVLLVAYFMSWYAVSLIMERMFREGGEPLGVLNINWIYVSQLAGIVLLLIVSAITGYIDGAKSQQPATGISKWVSLIAGVALAAFAMFLTGTHVFLVSSLTSNMPEITAAGEQGASSSRHWYSSDTFFLNGTRFKRYDGSFDNKNLPDPPAGDAALTGEFHLDDKPVPGITFDMVLDGQYRAKQIQTDANGRFTIPIQPGTWHIDFLHITAWDDKPEDRALALISGREGKLQGNRFEEHRFLNLEKGLPVEISADGKQTPPLVFPIRDKLKLVQPSAETTGLKVSTDSFNIRWQAFPEAKHYLVKLSELTREDDKSISYHPAAYKKVTDATQLALADLKTVPHDGNPLEYQVQVFAFDENNNYVTQSDEYFNESTIVVTNGKKIIEADATRMFGNAQAFNVNEYEQIRKNNKRLDAVKILIKDKLYPEAQSLLDKVQGKTEPGAKDAITAYLLAEQNQCEQAQKFFEKAKQASPSGCVPDCYMKNCQ